MAAQATVKKAAGAVSNGVIPPVPRLPKGPKEPKRRQFDYSRYLQTIHKAEDFAHFADGYPDKSGLCAYMYRLQPKIDFNLIGIRDAYIKKSTDAAEWSPAWLEANFGRGTYMIKLNDANRVKGQNDVAKIVIELMDCEKPAVYDLRTLKLTDPMNQDEIARLIQSGELVRDPNGAPRMRTAADGPAGTISMVAPALQNGGAGEFMTKEIFGQVLLSLIQRGTQDPSKHISDILSVAKTLQPQQTAPQLSVEQIVELVAAKIGRPKANGADDMFTAYERMETFIARVRGPVAVAAAAGGDGAAAAGASGFGWVSGVATIFSEIRQILPMLPMLRTLGGPEAPAAPGTIMRAAPPREPAQPPQASMTLDQRIEEIAQLGFARMEQKVNGWDYAAWVCNFHPGGREIFLMLEPGGPAAVMGLAAMNPATAPLLRDAAKRAQIESFLTDFFSFDASPAGAAESPAAGVSPAA